LIAYGAITGHRHDDQPVVKRFAWVGLGVIVFLIVMLDSPWPRPVDPHRVQTSVQVSTVPAVSSPSTDTTQTAAPSPSP
jgi:hypothetical protein